MKYIIITENISGSALSQMSCSIKVKQGAVEVGKMEGADCE